MSGGGTNLLSESLAPTGLEHHNHVLNDQWFNPVFQLFCRRPRTHEQMLDDQDDLRSTHSIGIVENPLYAEQEEYNTPSYATLKEKEAEVRVTSGEVDG